MYPVKPVSLPTVLQNIKNGLIPKSMLAHVGPGGLLIAPVARAFQALRYWAKTRLGVELIWTWGGTYRDFDSQWNLWFQRWEAVSFATYAITLPRHRREWRNAATRGRNARYWRLRKNQNGKYLAPAAEPGTSNHGIGIAIDIASGTHPREARAITSIGTEKWRALRMGIEAFGFSWELQSEPWHIRFVAGDAVPPIVVEMEQEMGHGKPLPPPAPPVNAPVVPAPPTPVKSTETLVSELPTLRLSDVSFHVHLAANMLIAHGHASLAQSPDFNALRFGTDMLAHVRWFQGVKGLTQDGVVGPRTWQALLGV